MVSLIKAFVCVLLMTTIARAEELNCNKQMERNGAPIPLVDRPFKISLVADASDGADITTAMLLIDGGVQRYCVETTLSIDPSDPPTRADALTREGRRHITWLSPYLLVRSDESTRQEVVNKTWIFKAANGTLVRLGAIGGDVVEESSGRFQSLYNKAPVWRAQAFGCMACNPRVHLVIDDRDGKLVANAEATWRLNEKERRDNYEYVNSQIRSGLPPVDEDVPTRSFVLRAFIENAVVAKYCGRTVEMDRLIALVNTHLDQASQSALTQALRGVVPLEIPDQWGAVWRE